MKGVSKVFQVGVNEVVPRKFSKCFKEVSRVFQGRLKGVFNGVLSGFKNFNRFLREVSKVF